MQRHGRAHANAHTHSRTQLPRPRTDTFPMSRSRSSTLSTGSYCYCNSAAMSDALAQECSTIVHSCLAAACLRCLLLPPASRQPATAALCLLDDAAAWLSIHPAAHHFRQLQYGGGGAAITVPVAVAHPTGSVVSRVDMQPRAWLPAEVNLPAAAVGAATAKQQLSVDVPHADHPLPSPAGRWRSHSPLPHCS
jgi:hypothetical protein